MESLEMRPSPASVGALAPPAEHSANCLNCGAALHGVYCSECGQRDIPPYPSVRELVIDAFWELSGWDGRFSSTVRALVRRPGMLTREFLEGRRARYLSPLRLYLMSSLIYFLIAAAVPSMTVAMTRDDVASLAADVKATGRSTPSAPERVAERTREAMSSDHALPDSLKNKALADIGRAPGVMQPFLRRAVLDPAGFKKGILEAMPRMLFALLPVFAAIVALFYHGRKYPEHFYFAIHLHAFTFLALGIAALTKLTGVKPLADVVQLAALVWIVSYGAISFRRVYGGSIAATLAKGAAIGVIYSVVSTAAFVITIYLVSLGA